MNVSIWRFFFSFLIFSSREDKDKEAIKAAILAQYNNVVEGDESEGDEEEDEEEFGKNTNAETVAKAAVEQRERCRIAAAEKKEKDKSDREKQKKDAEDRKKKAQEKAAKGERKRWCHESTANYTLRFKKEELKWNEMLKKIVSFLVFSIERCGGVESESNFHLLDLWLVAPLVAFRNTRKITHVKTEKQKLWSLFQ